MKIFKIHYNGGDYLVADRELALKLDPQRTSVRAGEEPYYQELELYPSVGSVIEANKKLIYATAYHKLNRLEQERLNLASPEEPYRFGVKKIKVEVHE